MVANYVCRHIDGRHACQSYCPNDIPPVFADLPDYGWVPIDTDTPEEDELGTIHSPGWTVQQPYQIPEE